jgi:four helix bundle protein
LKSGARYRKKRLNKVGIVFKELNESEVWLEMLVQRDTEGMEELRAFRIECSVLCPIIAASRKTAVATARIDTDRPKG